MNDCVRAKSEFTGDESIDIFVFVWNLEFHKAITDWLPMFAEKDYKVIMTPASHLYLDFPEEPDPRERGLYWATRFTDSKKILSYQPFDTYANSGYQQGVPYRPNFKCEKFGKNFCLPLEKPENLVGLQCSVWAETVMTNDQMLVQIFPRLFACAERAANPKPDFGTAESEKFQQEWEIFARKTQKYAKKLEEFDILYHLPNAGYDESQNLTNTAIPGMRVVNESGHWITYSFNEKFKSKHLSRFQLKSSNF